MTKDETATPSMIYHICLRSDWESGRNAEFYTAPDADRADGFLHFSNGEQIIESAAKHRAGQMGLVLIEADGAALGEALRWEVSRNGALFPHLYGPIPLDAVTAVHDLLLSPDGLHIFPEIG